LCDFWHSGTLGGREWPLCVSTDEDTGTFTSLTRDPASYFSGRTAEEVEKSRPFAVLSRGLRQRLMSIFFINIPRPVFSL
jgi:hypothetical protein